MLMDWNWLLRMQNSYPYTTFDKNSVMRWQLKIYKGENDA
jgi:hypothetical protein